MHSRSMRARLILLTLTILSCYSCSDEVAPKHSQLISFKSRFIMDMEELHEKEDADFERLTDSENFYEETDTIHNRFKIYDVRCKT